MRWPWTARDAGKMTTVAITAGVDGVPIGAAGQRWRWRRPRWRRTAALPTAPYVTAERPVAVHADDVVATELVVPIAVVDERAAAPIAGSSRRAPGAFARTVARALVAIDFALPGRRD